MEMKAALKIPQIGFSKIMNDYLTQDGNLKDMVTAFPSMAAFGKQFDLVHFDNTKRKVLVESLKTQYHFAGMSCPG